MKMMLARFRKTHARRRAFCFYLAKTKLCNNGVVALLVRDFEIFQMYSPVSNHLDEAAARMIVLLVNFQMIRKLIDFL